MPIFTIETTYHLPVFRHQSIEAESVEEACRLAVVDDDWETSERNYDASGDIHVTGIWEGDVRPYTTASIVVPARFEEAVQRKAELFATLLALLKEPTQPMGLGRAEFERWRPRATAAIAEVEAIPCLTACGKAKRDLVRRCGHPSRDRADPALEEGVLPRTLNDCNP